jgi:hypothetical protein
MNGTDYPDVKQIFLQVVCGIQKAVKGHSRVKLDEKIQNYIMKRPGAAPDVSANLLPITPHNMIS